MRREICGECDSHINDDGSCDCTGLIENGWRLCAKGQQTTQWCAMAETLLREQRQRDEALLRQALDRLEAVVEHFDPYMYDNECRPMENARSTIAILRERLRRDAAKESKR